MHLNDGGADYEQLFEQAPCGYLTTGDDGMITGVNETFLHWTGHERTALLGTPLRKLMPIGDQLLYSTHCVPQLAMLGTIAEVAVEIIGTDGRRRAAVLSAARTSATETAAASVRFIIMKAQERRHYEKELLSAQRVVEQSEVRRADAEAGLAHLTEHDPLTGLLNRAGLMAPHRLQATESAQRAGLMAVLIIDLDHFTAVNDGLGTSAGDELLVTLAERLRSSIRQNAVLARPFADEYVLVEDLSEPEKADALAERLLELISGPIMIQDLEIVVTASIGIAVGERKPGATESLLRGADAAMHKAKALGGNTWRKYNPLVANAATNHLKLLGELRQGIERAELRLHYQPRVDLRSGALRGVEALVRWQHPGRGLLPPAEFIDAAERSGLIGALGSWVLDHAVAQAVAWQHTELAGADLEMAVNLSARQMSDPNLVHMVAEILARHQLDPGLLTLEITETALMGEPDAAVVMLTALTELGISLAVDDFGTGYSSLTYLKRFPVNELKIDQSFVRGLGSNPDDTAIVSSCIALAHGLGIHAVAEGVETAQQRRALLELDCDVVQGYFFSRPLPPDELLIWEVSRSQTRDGDLSAS